MDAVAHLAGARSSPRGQAGPDLRLWEAACAIAGRTIGEDEAHGLRVKLGLDVSPWSLQGLQEVAAGPTGKLEWSASRRGRVLQDLERMEPLPKVGATLPGEGVRARALSYWRGRYDAVVDVWAKHDSGWRESAPGRLVRVERAALDLWERPRRR